MHKYFALAAWMILAIFGLGVPPQQQVQSVGGVLTLNLVPGTSSFKVILSANVTSVVIQNPTPGTIISVIFTENATGGFTVTFGGNIANPCTVSTSANATTTCQFQYDATNNTWNGIGGAGGGATSASYPAGVIDTTASKYATPIGQVFVDATFTSGQNTISIPVTESFSSSQTGWTCFGTNQTTDVSILSNTSAVLPEGTFTQTGAQTGTCSGGNSTATVTGAGVFVIGKLGHTQLNSAWTDCLAQLYCDMKLPPGPVLVEQPVGTAAVPTSGVLAQGYGRVRVDGYGLFVSQLIPTPNFSNNTASQATNCNSGPSTDLTGCFFSGTSVQMDNWSIYGAGIATWNAAFSGKTLIIVQGQQTSGSANTYDTKIALLSAGALTAGLTGIKFELNSGEPIFGLIEDGAGSIGCNVITNNSAPMQVQFIGVNCTVNNVTSLTVSGGGQFSSFGSIYGLLGTTALGNGAYVCNNSTAFCYSYGDSAPYQTGNNGGQFVALAGTFYVNGATAVLPSGGFYCFNADGGTLYVGNSTCRMPASGGQAFIVNASSTLISEGGNQVISGSGCNPVNLAAASAVFIEYAPDTWGTACAWNYTAGATVSGPATLYGSCTGTVTSATTVGLYNFGENSAVTCTVATTGLGQVMDRTGTILGIVAKAGTAGNQTADAATVVKNHQGTITVTTMTCSLNGVTSCADFTTGHQVAYAQGDVISVEAIAGTATTLANVTANVVRQ